MNRLATRIETAIRELDLGIPDSRFRVDFLGTVNLALRQLGAPIIDNLENPGALLRVALLLEARV